MKARIIQIAPISLCLLAVLAAFSSSMAQRSSAFPSPGDRPGALAVGEAPVAEEGWALASGAVPHPGLM